MLTNRTRKIVDRLVGWEVSKEEWALIRQAIRALVQSKRMFPVPGRSVHRFIGINVEPYTFEQALGCVTDTINEAGGNWKDAIKSLLRGDY